MFDEELEKKYPLMFTKQYGGVAVSEGWYPIIESLCQNIQSHIDFWNKNHENHPVVEQVVVEQIKEKFGGLRFYYQGGDDTIHGMVRMAEAWSERTCEVCGNPGKKRGSGGGWVHTACDEHA